MKLLSSVCLAALVPAMVFAQDVAAPDASEKAKPVDPIIASQHQGSGRLGVVLEFDKTTGIPRISGLTRGGPAADTGFMVGDVIIRIGRDFTNTLTQDEIRTALHGAPGSGVELTIQRGDNPRFIIRSVERRTLPAYAEEMVQPPVPGAP